MHGNVNVPGGKAAKSVKGTKGHGAEKKGAGETADNKKSTSWQLISKELIDE